MCVLPNAKKVWLGGVIKDIFWAVDVFFCPLNEALIFCSLTSIYGIVFFSSQTQNKKEKKKNFLSRQKNVAVLLNTS